MNVELTSSEISTISVLLLETIEKYQEDIKVVRERLRPWLEDQVKNAYSVLEKLDMKRDFVDELLEDRRKSENANK
jgi:type I site-specific restriction endonuclease